MKTGKPAYVIKGQYKGLSGKVTLVYPNGNIQIFVLMKSVKGGGIYMDFPPEHVTQTKPPQHKPGVREKRLLDAIFPKGEKLKGLPRHIEALLDEPEPKK